MARKSTNTDEPKTLDHKVKDKVIAHLNEVNRLLETTLSLLCMGGRTNSKEILFLLFYQILQGLDHKIDPSKKTDLLFQAEVTEIASRLQTDLDLFCGVLSDMSGTVLAHLIIEELEKVQKTKED